MHFWSASTGWPRSHHRALSKCCCISRNSVFQHLHSAFVEQQGRNSRLCYGGGSQDFQIKALMSSSTKMHGANTGVGSNTFCGSGVVFPTANRTTSQVQTMAWSASRTHHQLKWWTVKSVWVAAKKNNDIKVQEQGEMVNVYLWERKVQGAESTKFTCYTGWPKKVCHYQMIKKFKY